MLLCLLRYPQCVHVVLHIPLISVTCLRYNIMHKTSTIERVTQYSAMSPICSNSNQKRNI